MKRGMHATGLIPACPFMGMIAVVVGFLERILSEIRVCFRQKAKKLLTLKELFGSVRPDSRPS